MKKVLICFLVLYSVVCAYAQSSKTKVDFFVEKGVLYIDSAQNGGKYIVIPFEGKSATELYNSVLLKANSMFENPSKVITTVPNASIIINGHGSKVYNYSYRNSLFYTGDIDYHIELFFKDGKVRLNVPTITKLTEYESVFKETQIYDRPAAIAINVNWHKEISVELMKAMSGICNSLLDIDNFETDW